MVLAKFREELTESVNDSDKLKKLVPVVVESLTGLGNFAERALVVLENIVVDLCTAGQNQDDRRVLLVAVVLAGYVNVLRAVVVPLLVVVGDLVPVASEGVVVETQTPVSGVRVLWLAG